MSKTVPPLQDREIRAFRHWTLAQLDEARRIAVEVVKRYGDLEGDELQRFLERPWNDHCSVQAALRAMPRINEAASPAASDLARAKRLVDDERFKRCFQYWPVNVTDYTATGIIAEHIAAARAEGESAGWDAAVLCATRYTRTQNRLGEPNEPEMELVRHLAANKPADKSDG